MVMPSGLIMPPPRPWMTRKATRLVLLQASPQSSEPAVNSAMVIRNSRLVPKVSDRKPVAGMTTAMRQHVAGHDQLRFADARRRTRVVILGSAMFTIVLSSMTMNVPKTAQMSTVHW